MTDLNYHYSCQKIRNNLIDLYKSTEANTLTKTQMFKKIQALHQQIIDLSLLIESQQYEFGRKKLFLKLDSETMLTLVRTELRHIICLYYLKNKNSDIHRINELKDKINHSLNQRLETLLNNKILLNFNYLRYNFYNYSSFFCLVAPIWE